MTLVFIMVDTFEAMYSSGGSLGLSIVYRVMTWETGYGLGQLNYTIFRPTQRVRLAI
jgi:hypothetical protein